MNTLLKEYKYMDMYRKQPSPSCFWSLATHNERISTPTVLNAWFCAVFAVDMIKNVKLSIASNSRNPQMRLILSSHLYAASFKTSRSGSLRAGYSDLLSAEISKFQYRIEWGFSTQFCFLLLSNFQSWRKSSQESRNENNYFFKQT